MADITVASVYEQMVRTFKVGGTNRYDADFLAALNSTTAVLNRKAALTTRIARVEDRSGTIDLSDDYWDVLVDGVIFHMAKLGNRPQGDQNKAYIAEAEQRFLDGLESMYYDLINQRIVADADDESDDIIGHGHLG